VSTTSSDAGTWRLDTGAPAAPQQLSHHSNDQIFHQGVAVYRSGSGITTTRHVLYGDALVAKLYDTRSSLLGTSEVSLLPDFDPVTHLNYYPFSLVLDSTSVYFTHDTNQGIFKAPRGGGAAVTLVTSAARGSLVLASGNLYFQQGSDIKKMSSSGGSVTTFTAGVGTARRWLRTGASCSGPVAAAVRS